MSEISKWIASMMPPQVQERLSPTFTIKLHWKFPLPQGFGRATLSLPEASFGDDETALRPLRVYSWDNSPLVGVRVQLGKFSGVTDEKGRIWVTLEGLRPDWDGKLHVNGVECQVSETHTASFSVQRPIYLACHTHCSTCGGHSGYDLVKPFERREDAERWLKENPNPRNWWGDGQVVVESILNMG